MSRLVALGQRWQASFLGRTWGRYSARRGSILAGGIAYFSFFSVIPALAIGFTVLGVLLGDNTELQRQIVDYVNATLGSPVIGLASDTGIVTLDSLIQPSTLTFSAVSGLVVLAFTGLGWLDATREGIRAIFGRPSSGNVLLTKLRDLGVLATFGVAVLFSAVATVAVTTVSNRFLDVVGLDGRPGAGTVVTLVSASVLLAIDTGIFLVLFRWLARVEVPVEYLWQGALAGGLGIGALKLFGGLLLGLLSGNGFFATFSVVVGLLVWMNLVGRVTLLAASWAATRAADAGALPELPATAAAETAEPPAAARAGPGRRPTYGIRTADRTTLAAGVVLGMAGATALRVARGALRTVVGAVRG